MPTNLSLANLRDATAATEAKISDVMGTTPSAGDNISFGSFTFTSVGPLNGYTYGVENTNEAYELQFNGGGTNFSKLSTYTGNFTWSRPAGTTITIGGSQHKDATITFSDRANSGVLNSVSSNTLRVVYDEDYNSNDVTLPVTVNKTVYSVDSYDGNSTALCLTSDTPVTLPDGTTIEIGDVEEGMTLKGYSLNGLDSHDDSNYIDWNTSELNQEEVEVEVENVVFSFANRYYNINNGEVKATAEHPFLVLEDGTYRFKRTHLLNEGDVLIKADEEVIIESIEVVDEDVEIVSLDVTNTDTYLANGFITHNKGGNSHTDFDGPTAPTSVSYSHPSLSWSGGTADTDSVAGITAYDIQVDNNSDFSSPVINETNWNTTSIQLSGVVSAGTYYARVRNKQSGLNSGWTTVGGNNSSFTVTAWPA